MVMPAATRDALKSAGRVAAVAISSGAALVSILGALRSYGVFGGTTAMTVGEIGVAWVGVAPTADTMTAIGDTIHLAATVTDNSGTVLVGSSLVWSSDNAKVATVGADGTVIARGPGTTTVVAAVGTKVARARVTVQQVAAAVKVNGDSAITIGDGDELPLVARAVDARGFPMPARAATWQSGNRDLLALDSLGVATAKAPGKTTVSATIGGITGSVPVTIVAVPASIELVAGGAQRALAGDALPQQLIVRILSKRGRPVPGASVRFRAEDGAGGTDSSNVASDSLGRARAHWTLGAIPGRQRLFVSVDHVDSALIVAAEAEPVAANTRISQLGEPSAPAGTTLADPAAIRLTDSTGRALADIPVSWAALDGGSVSGGATRTDSLGEARAKWTLGTSAGTQRLRVQIGSGRSVPPFIVTATANAGAPAAASILTGDSQKGAVNAELAKPVTLRVADKLGNPVTGVRVALSTQTGSLADSVVVTDSLGRAQVRWTLARTAGAQKLVAKVDGIAKSLTVAATAVPGDPANLTLSSDATSGVPGKALAKPVVGIVTDDYDNPIANVPVVFSTKQGSVTPARIVTDAKGRVQTKWTLGATPGDQELSAVVKGQDVRGTFTVQASTKAAPAAKPAGASKPVTTPKPAPSKKKTATKRTR